ncbi:MAG: MarR family winged helix-turn-helix transcriptional regulator [Chloroflexota bacterium]
MSEQSTFASAEKATDLFVSVLAKALTQRLLDEQFAGRVTTAQVQGLRYLAHNEERLMSDLAEGLGISYPAATKTVERLVRKGLVVRESDPADRRVVRVRLTEAGDRLISDIDGARTDMLSTVLAKLPPEDHAALMQGLGAFINAALKEVEDDSLLTEICLHCGDTHQAGCPVAQALERTKV